MYDLDELQTSRMVMSIENLKQSIQKGGNRSQGIEEKMCARIDTIYDTPCGSPTSVRIPVHRDSRVIRSARVEL